MTLLDDMLPASACIEIVGDFERHTLPSGVVVYYRDRDHSYWRDVKEDGSGTGRIPGASTIVKPVDYKADGLLRWAAKSNGEGIAILAAEAMRLAQTYDEAQVALSFLESEETIWVALTERKLTYDDLRNQRAREGTNVHERVLHALATSTPVPPIEDFPAEEQGYAKAVMSWWNRRNPLPKRAEQVVYSAKHDFAGRLDLLARVGEERWLVDLKTSGYMSMAHHLQLIAYDLAARESGFGGSNRQIILQVIDDGTWHEHECQANEEMLIHALAVHRDAAELGKRLRKQRQAAGGSR